MSGKAIIVANTGFSIFHFRLPLMKYLAARGWSVVAVANDEADYASKFEKEGIRFIDTFIDHKGKNPLADFAFMQRMASIYRHESPDLVHHFTIKPIIFGSLAAKLAHVPAIVNTITGLGYVFEQHGFLMKSVMGLYKAALSGRAFSIFQNRDDQHFFIKNNIVKSSRTLVIPGSGVDTEALRPMNGGAGNGILKCLMVSRMLWSKGVGEYVRAAGRIKEQFAGISFKMAGGASGGGARGNPEAVPVEWLNRVNREGIVQWVGRVPFDEVVALLDDSDVFIVPSYYPEGIPRSLIEAAAKGKAIITTDTPGCREVVVNGVNGFLVPPKDPDAIADCLLEFIRNPGLVRQMGTASRKRAVDIFEEKKILAQTSSVYNSLGATN